MLLTDTFCCGKCGGLVGGPVRRFPFHLQAGIALAQLGPRLKRVPDGGCHARPSIVGNHMFFWIHGLQDARTLLARVGALNKLDGIEHRRDALWQVERAGKLEGPLLRQNSNWLRETSDTLPLQQMNTEERLVADYAGAGLTVGKHPMHYRRQELQSRNVLSAVELRCCRDGEYVKAAGCVIARQRPGTAKGFIFISMEDETGIANVIVTPDLYERERLTVVRSKFLLVEGILQNQDGVIHVKATRLTALVDSAMELRSHDFH